MKKSIYLSALLTVLMSCKKEFSLNVLNFDVELPKNVFEVNEPVDFKINSNADIISFYSGEIGNDYAFRSGRIMESELSASFDIKFVDGVQNDQLSVLVSNNLKSYSLADVNTATWVEITDRFTFPDKTNQNKYISVGYADLNDLIEEGKPLYFAFRYTNRSNAIYGSYDNWEFSTFLMKQKTELEDVILLNQTTANWKIVLDGQWESGRVVKYSKTFRFIGNVVNNPQTQIAWAISAPIYISRSTDLGADAAIPIKSLADAQRTEYTHAYSRPGIYTVTFIGANQNVSDRKEILKKYEIKVISK